MAAAIGLTGTDPIRSVLGVSEQDAPDSLLLGRRLDIEQRIDLLSWLPDYQAKYDAGTAPGATVQQKDLSDALELYCAYLGAAALARVGPLLFVQQISDGKNMLARFTPIDWDKLRDGMNGMAEKYKAAVIALAATGTGATSNTDPLGGVALLRTVGLATDPVTDSSGV